MTALKYQRQHLVALTFLIVATVAFPSTAAPSERLAVAASNDSERHAGNDLEHRPRQDDEHSDKHDEHGMREAPAEARAACLSENDGHNCSFTAAQGPAQGKTLSGKCMEGICQVERKRKPAPNNTARDTQIETNSSGGKGDRKSRGGDDDKKHGKHQSKHGGKHGRRQADVGTDATFDTNEAYDMESQHRAGGRAGAGGPGEGREHPEHGGHGRPTDCAGKRGAHSNVRGAADSSVATGPGAGGRGGSHNASHLEDDGCGGGHAGRHMPPHARTAAIAGGCAFVALAAVFVVRRRRNRNRNNAPPSTPAVAVTAPLPVPIAPGVPVALVGSAPAKDAGMTAVPI